ncbi:UvrD-helicase domain-containing protein [Clostridium perfringens]|uniref:UvrD-helicase domain-containing protein n=1 Tax=Clostridium perfringens TaxID=1502 RepID=UPI001A1CF073|nr:ATP-dependent helicase [Clostridium perfringens]MDK0983934.1 ATP-dependent helicase [Clostridium perfringens]MDU2436084.1 ATP-dependent helicase [Clostridium perfringens]MDU2516729.1 ATP-dependent helicase [Clostridium perfringens]MDU6896677.1 ATP-dependent helicase [Clostridium perfringens]
MEQLDKRELCKYICKREICDNNINLCSGTINSKCKSRNQSCLEFLNKEQLGYILSDINKNIYLKACPGSGKTEVLGVKSAYEINKWLEKDKGIAILTFTNSAEDEIRSRVESYLNKKIEYPHFIGTFTSWIHGYIGHAFIANFINYQGDELKDKSLKVIDSDINSEFLKLFSTKYKYNELNIIRANQYYYDLKSNRYKYSSKNVRDGDKILEKLLKSDSWRNDELKRLKEKFWRNGYITYEDFEYNIYKLFSTNKEITRIVANRFPKIFVDECQDLSYIQLKILNLLMKQGVNLHLIGDINQAIYGFRDIEPKDITEFINLSEFYIEELNTNYRSCKKIVDICGDIIRENNNINAAIPEKCMSSLIIFLYEKNKEQKIIDKFQNLITKYNFDNNKCKIIVRNINLKNKILGYKNSPNSENILEILAKGLYWRKNCINIEQYKEGYINICKAIRYIFFYDKQHLNSTQFYRPICMEILEWKALISKITINLNDIQDLLDYTLTWTEWKDKLKKELIILSEKFDILDKNSIRLPNIRKGYKDKVLKETLFISRNQSINCDITTVHSSKGLSFDAVLFMSSYQGASSDDSGAFWKQWFDNSIISEKNRIAYVGFSRAKYLLVLGIPKTKNFSDEDYNLLESKGFKIIDINEDV